MDEPEERHLKALKVHEINLRNLLKSLKIYNSGFVWS